jgi:flagellin-like protein
MKKGITPIIAVIILLLITVALAGMAWAFLSGYFTGLTGKTIAVVDYSCVGGNTAQAIIRNSATGPINFGTNCNSTVPGAILINGTTFTCGDLTITRTDGGTMQGRLDKGGNLPSNENLIFSDSCTAGTTCTYRFVTSSAGIGPNPNIATVTC